MRTLGLAAVVAVPLITSIVARTTAQAAAVLQLGKPVRGQGSAVVVM